MRAQIRGFPTHFVDREVQGDNAPGQFPPDIDLGCSTWAVQCKDIHKMLRDFLRNLRNLGGKTMSRAAKIGARQHDGGAEDADAYLCDTGEIEVECSAVGTTGCPEFPGGDDGRGVAGKCGRIGCEISQ